jgi:hypothetical protein
MARLAWAANPATAGALRGMPEDFPRFIVPGHEQAMANLRSLHWLHCKDYGKRSKPMPTAWNEWMTGSTLWPAVESNDGINKTR